MGRAKLQHPQVYTRAWLGCGTDWKNLLHTLAHAAARAGGKPGRGHPTRLQFPLVCARVRSVAHWVGLGCSTHQFAQHMRLGTELTRQLQSPVCAQADVRDGLNYTGWQRQEIRSGSPQFFGRLLKGTTRLKTPATKRII